jgi:hypothetical protein
MVTIGTVFAETHIPLNKWLYAIHLMCSSKKGVSALHLSRTVERTWRPRRWRESSVTRSRGRPTSWPTRWRAITAWGGSSPLMAPSTTPRRSTSGAWFTVNFSESYFSLFKRGIIGALHHISRKHIQRYLEEFDFRWNRRKISDSERMLEAVAGVEGKRLFYRAPKWLSMQTAWFGML